MKYRYNVNRGLEKIKTNTKKYVFSGLAAITFIGGATGASFAATNSNNNASCFGQARSYYAKGGPNGVLDGSTQGTYSSQRKGTNPENNAQYIADHCTS